MTVWFLVVIPGAALLAPLGYHLGYRRSGPGGGPASGSGRAPAAPPASPLLAPVSAGSADGSSHGRSRLAADLDEATRWGWLADVGWIAFVVVLLWVALRLA